MDYRHLGRTGLRVSPLCLGTMNFGPETDEATGHQIMDAALDAGINFFDTANVYGGRRDRADHRPLVRRRAAAAARRSCWPPRCTAAADPWPNTSRLSALHIRQACEDSLRRLQTDHIDLYQMHHVDRDTPWDEIWQAMDLLVAQGKVIYVGSSNFAGWHIAQANEAATPARLARAGVGAEPLQPEGPHGRARGAARAAEAYGIGVIPWSPLGGGLLGGRAAQGDRGPAGGRARAAAGRARPRPARGVGGAVRRARRGAGRRGAGLAAPPAGGHGADHRPPHDGAVHRARCAPSTSPSTPEVLDRLDKIFPGPGGRRPEAYAW